MAGEDGPDPGMVEMDDLIDSHLDAMEGSADSPKPEDVDPDDITPEGDDEITPEGDLDADDEEDIEEEDDTGEEDLEDDDEFDDEDEEDEEDEDADEDEDDADEEEVEQVLESVTAEELDRIEEDPVLKRLYRSMQRDYTKKTKAVSERENDLESRQKSIEDFEGALRSAQGMADYLAGMLERRPDVVGSAFEAVAQGDRGREFLVAVGVEHPDVFEEAYERFHEIVSDDDEKRRYIKERDHEIRDAELQQREDRIKRSTFDREYNKLTAGAEKEMRRLGLDEEYRAEVIGALNEKVRGHVREDGTIIVGLKDAKAAAQRVKKEVERIEAKVRNKAKRRQVKESSEATKKRARRASGKKRVPPRGARRKTPSTNRKFKAPAGVDPMDAFVDHEISRLNDE